MKTPKTKLRNNREQFRKACENGDLDAVTNMIQGNQISSLWASGFPLRLAAMKGHLDVARAIMDRSGSRPGTGNVVESAMKGGAWETAISMISHPSMKLNLRSGNTLIHMAVHAGKNDGIKAILCDLRLGLTTRKKLYWSAITYAIDRASAHPADTDILEWLLDEPDFGGIGNIAPESLADIYTRTGLDFNSRIFRLALARTGRKGLAGAYVSAVEMEDRGQANYLRGHLSDLQILEILLESGHVEAADFFFRTLNATSRKKLARNPKFTGIPAAMAIKIMETETAHSCTHNLKALFMPSPQKTPLRGRLTGAKDDSGPETMNQD